VSEAQTFELAPPVNAFVFERPSFRSVKTSEWLELGVPIVTGIFGGAVAVYSLSGKADPERLRTTQFFLALLSIGIAVTTVVSVGTRVSTRIAEERGQLPSTASQ
jgi:hypothetical protein